MFFKSAIFFQICCPADAIVNELRTKIKDHLFRPCDKNQLHSIGFHHPYQDDLFFHEQQGAFLFRVKMQARQIPASALNEQLEEKVAELEESQGRKVYRKERLAIKDEIVQELLPTAIPVSKCLDAYVDSTQGLIIFNTSSPAQADKAMAFIREAIGGFPVIIPCVNNSPALAMTKWLQAKPPKCFTIGSSCKLADPVEGGAVVTIKHDDLHSEAIEAMLDEGKLVESLDATWDEQVRLTIAQAHILKGIHFSLQLLHENDEIDEGLVRFDADLALMANTFQQLIPDLGKSFGGYLEQELMDFTGKEKS